MHATQLLNNHLQRMCQGIHKKRMLALMSMVNACIQGKKTVDDRFGSGGKQCRL